MTNKRFVLVAIVSTDNPKAIRPVLEKLVGHLALSKKLAPKMPTGRAKASFSYKKTSKD